MKTGYKKILLIMPSKVIARGIEAVLSELGEFRVEGILSDLSHVSEARLRNMDADVILIDPVLADYTSRMNVRSRISEYSSAAVVALKSVPMDEEQLKQYDGAVGLYDDPVAIVRKLRESLSSREESPESEGYDLSAREKDILVCVAKGMLNKEIADHYNISIHTVITHRKNITRKTGIKTVAGLTVYALLNNLIDSGSIDL
ncbi:MAG: response regulator transcription factor [Bacteroidales bacterium]|jgi:DNA-binding NarL/FixJ family response regulator|nr:response regulator transcription factor [Bacteroidales bacterium]MBO5075427.1 response regulator transcription factor [Bacteroidales bacterium]MBO5075923.1 response regulator transcription factor [Bacteroidales bacterium]MBQ8573380.1 response regulator transcription factor [Bacteroidales bacterium]